MFTIFRHMKPCFLTLNLVVMAILFFILFYNSDDYQFPSISASEVTSLPSTTITIYNAKNKTSEVSVMADLGDQMFLYASLLGLAIFNNRKPLIDGVTTLGQIFQISYNANNKSNAIETEGWPELIHRHRGIVTTEYFLLQQTNITLKGNFQSWKYFDHIQARIRREFTFQPGLQKIANTFIGNLINGRSSVTVVGVHVYKATVKPTHNKKLIVAPLSYFIKAIKLMRPLLHDRALFIVSSDDPKWCRENFNDQSDLIVLDSGHPEEHLAILSRTTHLIISTGSFGWWAAWLADGVTIYYNVENRGYSRSDYFPDTWLGIGD